MGKYNHIIQKHRKTEKIMDGKGKGKEEAEAKRVHYRLFITCKKVKDIEDITRTIIDRAKTNSDSALPVKVKGPKRMPTKCLRITTRKSPCGNGTNTFDKFEMRIHKRVIDFDCTREDLQRITKIEIPAGVIIEANELD